MFNADGHRIASSAGATANFWAWYRRSVLLDCIGRPLVAYHYTNAEIHQFDHRAGLAAYRQACGFTTDFGKDFAFPARGFFTFAGEPPACRHKKIGMAIYVRIERPLDMRTGLTGPEASKLIDHLKAHVDRPPSPGHWGSRLRGEVVGGLRRARLEGLTGAQLWDLVNLAAYSSRGQVFDDILNLLDKDGMLFPANSAGTYLGDRMAGPGDGKAYLVAVARDPSQLKSATGNSGQFACDSPSICDENELTLEEDDQGLQERFTP